MRTTESPTRENAAGSRLEKRLLSYGVAAGAMLAGGASASAAVQFFDYSNNPQTTPVNGSLYFSLQFGNVPPSTTQGANSFRLFQNSTSPVRGAAAAGLANGANIAILLPADPYALKIGAGQQIGGSRDFGVGGSLGASSNGTLIGGGSWIPGNLAFLGLKFTLAGTTRYGWAEVLLNNDYTVTLYGVAYETTADTAITTPPTFVPEPSELALLAVGAAGLAMVRKRRKAAAA